MTNTEEISKDSKEYKTLKTQQILDIKALKEIKSRTQFIDDIVYLNRYRYSAELRDFYDNFLNEYITL